MKPERDGTRVTPASYPKPDSSGIVTEMRRSWSSPSGQTFLLALFCVAIVCVWMAPVLLAGFPYDLTPSVKTARAFSQTGMLGNVINPLFILVLAALQSVLDWRDATGWAFVSSVTLALATIPLWWSIRRLFGTPTAWASVILFCLLPMHWREAIATGYYPLAYLCLFTGFASFLLLVERNRVAALCLLGFFFGLTLATSHAFFTLLPWFVIAYAWERGKYRKQALMELAACGLCAYVGFVLPLLPNALRPGMSAAERAGAFLPVEENLMQPAELYGDDYAYRFLKDDVDKAMADKANSGSFTERRDNENFRINYGVGSFNPLHVILNGTWLFGNALASYVMQEMTGGFFLWLLILPGVAALYATNKRMLAHLLGLVLSMELVLRFVFHYARPHVMDVGWVVALLAGSGAAYVAESLHKSAKWRANAILAAIVALSGLQLMQTNRTYIAREYARSGIPAAMAVAEEMDKLPADAVIAQPRHDTLMAFTDRSSILLADTTIDMLIAKGKLADPFRHYKVTHVVGYDDERTAAILKAVPTLKAIPVDEAASVPLTPFKRYLLNLIR